MLTVTRDSARLYRGDEAFDPWHLRWTLGQGPTPQTDPVTPLEALAWLYRQPNARRVPLAIIGPKVADERQVAVAEALGRRLGELRVPLITGGRSGVMEAASRGCLLAGGMPIGILPGDEWDTANDYVTIPLATGLGPARNAVIARAAFALVAIGGEYGTLSEMAFGLHFNRLVLALENAPSVPGAIHCADGDEVLTRVAERLFALGA